MESAATIAIRTTQGELTVMKVVINDTELEGVTKIAVELQREVDDLGLVQAALDTPRMIVERTLFRAEQSDLAAFESFADVGTPATVEIEFTNNNSAVAEIKLSDVIIERPVLDLQAGRLVEIIEGRGGRLELVNPEGGEYERNPALYPNAA